MKVKPSLCANYIYDLDVEMERRLRKIIGREIELIFKLGRKVIGMIG